MALWKRKKKRSSEDVIQKDEITESREGSVSPTGTETSPSEAQPGQEGVISEKMPEFESYDKAREDLSSGVILYGKKISSSFGKAFWGILSILILPPITVFAMCLLVIVSMLILPLLGVAFVATIPAVLVTLAIFLIVLPVLFPLFTLFILITGKGRLLIGSDGKWFGIEMFGKSYSVKNMQK